ANYLQLKDVLGKAVQWPEAEELITEQFNQAQKFQAQNGGMAFWTARNDFVSPYLSVYTALAFTWLEEMGYEVPTQVKTRLNSYLQDKILDAKQKSDQVDSLRI